MVFFQRLEAHTDWIWCVTFSPNGKYLATASGDEKIIIWTKKDNKWKLKQRLTQHSNSVRIVAFNADSSLLASGSTDRTVIVWNTQNWQPVWNTQNWQPISPLKHDDWLRSLAFSKQVDGTEYLATASQDGTIKLWDTQTIREWNYELSQKQEHPDHLKFKVHDLYERMNITGTNLDESTKLELKALGAVEDKD